MCERQEEVGSLGEVVGCFRVFGVLFWRDIHLQVDGFDIQAKCRVPVVFRGVAAVEKFWNAIKPRQFLEGEVPKVLVSVDDERAVCRCRPEFSWGDL